MAVLRLHVGSSYHVTTAPYSCERGRRITQMYPFSLAQKDYFCTLVGVLGEAYFGELRHETV